MHKLLTPLLPSTLAGYMSKQIIQPELNSWIELYISNPGAELCQSDTMKNSER